MGVTAYLLSISIGDGLGEWVKCDNGLIGVQSFDNNGITYHFHHTPTFNVKLGDVVIHVIQLCIKRPGKSVCYRFKSH